ncbi:hypothetical protein bcgnr5378_28350 [Bacillus cereus]|uniref:Uncharacterized protein n=1 Tax=Bacillus cereus TaxID=1396 RepID=A0A164P7C7_BACCE|nr:hypothetical protein [Bacillus cereus]KZD66356.1 hypothetical protein B4088_2472 [Bacillus cereus]GCF71546.1 hypothetical protein BC2903_53650 [Bacillus cereus]
MKRPIFSYYKPKHVGLLLNMPPHLVSRLAYDIESKYPYRFPKSSLGSYQFQKSDIYLIRAYAIVLSRTQDKEYALLEIADKLEEVQKKEYPDWFSHIQQKNLPIL